MVRVVIVSQKKLRVRRRRTSLGNEFPGRPKKSKVERRIHRNRTGGEFTKHRRIARFVEDLAELKKIASAQPVGVRANRGNESRPKFRVHVPNGVNAVTVYAIHLHPMTEDVDEAAHHFRPLREQVIQPGKVPV